MDNKNLKDGKTPIKLNRKMRMWNRYRNYCIGAAGIVVVLLICVGVINIVGKSSKDDTGAVPPTTQQAVKKTEAPTPQAATDAALQPTTPQASSTAQATTAAVLTGSYSISGKAEAVEFTSEDFFKDSVFIGDAIVSGIGEYGFLDSAQTVGNNNLTTDKALNYVSDVAAANPSKVFIMVGLNDINYGTRSAQDIAENLVALANEIKSKAPSSKVYIVSILPVTYGFENKDTNKITQADIDAVNGEVSILASNAKISYIDAAESFKTESGYLSSDYTSSGANITYSYYPFLLNGIAGVAK